ncbi:pyridoxamine 5'-phosphate oxidase family protein [Umezawaea sp.]|uniref:pyridoxamine 5'-phosphate oxidase family protein n=1 Tax=Umezawaea sp. TaxID=1955258 RepID=UPI002ED56F78
MTGATAASPADEVRKLAELASGIRVGMLTTIDEVGRLISRPMAQQEVEFDGDLWFFAERDSRKVAHIVAIPEVSVTLTSKDTWISIFGTAELVDDRAKARELWNGWVEAWLPQGPDDPNVVLVKVTAMSAEYWDTPGGRIASALSFVKSKVSGERYDGGDHATVDL